MIRCSMCSEKIGKIISLEDITTPVKIEIQCPNCHTIVLIKSNWDKHV